MKRILKKIKLLIFKLIYFFPLFFLLFPMTNSLYGASFSSIKTRDKVYINNEKIKLGDIAEIHSKDRRTDQILKNIIIGNAPLPGQTRFIDHNYIQIRLKQNGIDPSGIVMQGPKSIEVVRSFIKIPKKKVEKIISDFIYANVPWDKKEVSIKSIKTNDDMIFPAGNITYEIVPPKNMNRLSKIPMAVDFKVNGKFQKRIWTIVNLAIYQDVVFVKRPIGRYQKITEEYICLKKMDISRLPSNTISDMEEALGKRAGRKINSQSVLRADQIELPPLVKRGDVVLIIAESDSLRVTALGEVKKTAGRGDRIRVVNLDSKKGVFAKVVDSHTVKVEF